MYIENYVLATRFFRVDTSSSIFTNATPPLSSHVRAPSIAPVDSKYYASVAFEGASNIGATTRQLKELRLLPWRLSIGRFVHRNDESIMDERRLARLKGKYDLSKVARQRPRDMVRKNTQSEIAQF